MSSRRSYHSPRREAQAQATREAILDAARVLFADRGVATTTITEIAEAAAVARATVVAAFGTKRAMLEALIARLARGGDAFVPVAERNEWRAMVGAGDAADLLQRHAHIARGSHERTAELIDIVSREAPMDPELEDLRRAGAERRLRDTRQVVDALADRSWLRAGLTRSQAAETLWALNHPVLYRTLTADRGWPPLRWERWLADVSCRVLVDGG
jgi:AcrR family transcriptional regulator